MFNTLFKYFLLLISSERTEETSYMWTIEAKEALGRGVSMPSSLWLRSEKISGASVAQFSPRLLFGVD